MPLQGVEVNGGQITVAVDKARVKDAPNIAEDGHLSPEEEQQLYLYYGMGYGGDGGGTTMARPPLRPWAGRPG